MKPCGIVALTISFLAFSCVNLKAQYQTDQQIGFMGLKAGSQPDPGIYLILPLYWQQSDISICGPQNNQLFKNVSGALNAFVLPNLAVATPYKLLGATSPHSTASFRRRAGMVTETSTCSPPFRPGTPRTPTFRQGMHSWHPQGPGVMVFACG
jgi:hypothetical protein